MPHQTQWLQRQTEMVETTVKIRSIVAKTALEWERFSAPANPVTAHVIAAKMHVLLTVLWSLIADHHKSVQVVEMEVVRLARLGTKERRIAQRIVERPAVMAFVTETKLDAAAQSTVRSQARWSRLLYRMAMVFVSVPKIARRHLLIADYALRVLGWEALLSPAACFRLMRQALSTLALRPSPCSPVCPMNKNHHVCRPVVYRATSLYSLLTTMQP